MRCPFSISRIGILLGILHCSFTAAECKMDSFAMIRNSPIGISSNKPLRVLSTTFSKILSIRGGKKEKKSKGKKPVEKAVIEIAEELIEEETFDEDDDSMIHEEASRSNQMVSSISEIWIKTPPITQVYIGATMIVSLLVFVLNKNIWPEFLNLDWMKVFTEFQIWRPFTAFLFFGPVGLNFILTIHFVWTYMSQLEKMNFNAPEDFFILMVFGSVSLLPLYSMLGLSTKFLGHNLSTYLVYIWGRIFEGTEVDVMGMFYLRAELLPWFFCAQTLVLEGEIPFTDLLGIVVGHLYYYLKKRQLLVAPSQIKSFFSSDSMIEKYAKFRADFELM